MNKKQLKRLKRSKLKKKQHNISKMPTSVQTKISSGLIKLYHFTNDYLIDSIKKYGLVLGDVIIKEHKGFNAVNLTEQGHWHDPSLKVKDGLKTDIRITVRMDTSDSRLQNMHHYIGKSKTKDLMHSPHKGGEGGHVKYHWFYEGVIPVDDFVAVHRWNGKEFVEIDIHSLNGIKKGGENHGIAFPRLLGNFLYDKSGLALEVMRNAELYHHTSTQREDIQPFLDALDKMHQIVFDFGEHEQLQKMIIHILMMDGFSISTMKLNQIVGVGFQIITRISLLEPSFKDREDFNFCLVLIRQQYMGKDETADEYMKGVINAQKQYLRSMNALPSEDFTMSCARRVA